MSTDQLMRLSGVRQTFKAQSGKKVRAVDGVDLGIVRGETLGVVGESGCGKSTLARISVLLHRPTEGTVAFDGEDVTGLKGRALRQHRRKVQMVFQDPNDSLDPRFSVARSVMEPLLASGVSRPEARQRAEAALVEVGLGASALDRFPHEFSGGQRQRIGIARAIAMRPELVVLDEPTSALDVSIQSQILNLLLDLQRRQQLTYLFISHNLAVVRHLSDRVAVMYLGRIVEIGPATEVLDRPLHPYTVALLSALPNPEPGGRRTRVRLEGDIPSPTDVPPGCPFASRCWLATDHCREVRPELVDEGDGHEVACHRVADVRAERGNAVDRAPVPATRHP